MTAEKQYVDDYVSAYQGKTWSAAKMFGIMLVVCITMAIRDIGMVFVYGSIYDKIALEGVDTSISFMNYVFMVLLYLLPLILPAILRLTNGAYDNEPEAPLFPTLGSKAANIIMYVVVGLVAVVPVVLFAIGVFTTAYMFVALNMALMIFSSVAIFYYFGTYMLQRARKGLAQKYLITSVLMVVVSLASFVIAAGAVVGLHLAGMNVSLVEHMTRFLENWELVDLIVKAALMFVTVFLAAIVAGLIYNYTQNIIYSATPAVIFAFSNVVLLQRVREASTYLTSAAASIADYQKKLEGASDKNAANYKAKIAELEANIPGEQVSLIICYIFIGIAVVALVAMGAYAVISLMNNLKEAKKAK